MKKWFIVNPDSESYTEKYFYEMLEYLAKKYSVKCVDTGRGRIRDTGHGLEREFSLSGQEKDIELFVQNLEEVCHI